MYEFFVNSFRYFFAFYIVYFLWQGVCFVLIERGKISKSKKLPVIKQQITIVFIHIKAFAILAFQGSESGSMFNGAGVVFSTTPLLIGGSWLVLFALSLLLQNKFYKNSCPLIWNGLFFLTSVSLIILTRLEIGLASRQSLWLLVALTASMILPLFIYFVPKLERLELLYLFAGLGLLLSTFVFGTEDFGAMRWIQIGGFTFSPAELVSFSYIFYLASVFRKKLTFKQLIFPSLMAVAHVVILVAQVNLGGALIFFMSYMIIMYTATGRELLFLAGIALFIAGAFVAYELFAHVQIRVAIWRNPWADAHGIGYQIIQSLFAIGTWGAFGSGLTLGLPHAVPVVARDMTFAAIAEELGAIFAMGLIGVYIMIFYRGVHIALRCKRRYYSLLAVGFTGVIAFQTFLIIGGTINLIPLTGVTLPLISYGGSSLVMTIIKISMLQWIFNFYENEENEMI